METGCAVEIAVRDSRSRLLAYLSSRSGDLTSAEDALSEAVLAALEKWPRSGVPERPEAWLLTVARRRLVDSARHTSVQNEARPTLLTMAADAQALANSQSDFPDERLKLLFLCGHPAIAAIARTPLMLQIVLGLDAARIASAFLVSPSSISQRLLRAKAKIRDAGISFELPTNAEALGPRLDSVLEAIYAAYARGWDDVTGADARRRGLALEAIDLGRILTHFLPDEPEALGLLSLMLHCEARHPARRGAEGQYIPLSEQNSMLWLTTMQIEAEDCLIAASRLGRMGRFQLEAAIQSAHAQRALTGATDWESIALLYEGLVRFAPTIGNLVGRAAAVAEARDASVGLALLAQIDPQKVANYQPFWALTAHLQSRLKRSDEASAACQRAAGLSEDPAMRVFLLERSTLTDTC